MELEPGMIFAIITGAALLLIIGTGLALAAGLYGLDRTVRTVRARSTAGPYVPVAEPQPRAPTVAEPPTLSPVSQMMARGGYVEVPETLGLRHTKLGMWTFLGSEMIFFTALIGAYLLFRLTGKITAEMLEHIQGGPTVMVVAVNTFILLTSSFAVVLALDSLLVGKTGRSRLFLLGVFVLGSAFVALQAYEWSNPDLGVNWSTLSIPFAENSFKTVFFVLTGFHGMHVVVGLLWLLLFLLPRSLRGTLRPEHAGNVEIFGLYWHFVDIVWIILFTIIYLL